MDIFSAKEFPRIHHDLSLDHFEIAADGEKAGAKRNSNSEKNSSAFKKARKYTDDAPTDCEMVGSGRQAAQVSYCWSLHPSRLSYSSLNYVSNRRKRQIFFAF